VFVLSAVYASVGGSLYAHYITVISPEIFLPSRWSSSSWWRSADRLYWGAVVGASPRCCEGLRRFGDWELPLYGLP
jgi:branched-chain amino acid transport system permease protein